MPWPCPHVALEVGAVGHVPKAEVGGRRAGLKPPRLMTASVKEPCAAGQEANTAQAAFVRVRRCGSRNY